MGREESRGLYWRRRKEREPEFLVEQESGIWLEVLIFGGEEFCGDLRRRESCLGGKSTHWRNGQDQGPCRVSCLQAGAQAASILTLEPQASVCRPEQ